ncbi:elongin-B [Planococcus citri]|uniref:elongin-B n=1 Tax=Planococcus citri TaxID=170843 RepID=UPI0031F8DB4B
MDVYLMIQRKKLTIFTDAKDNTDIQEVKKIIEGIIKVAPENQMLFTKDHETMEDEKTLSDYGYNTNLARAQSPGFIGLAIKQESGEFETLDLEPYSTPPDLPYVMKNNAECAEST